MRFNQPPHRLLAAVLALGSLLACRESDRSEPASPIPLYSIEGSIRLEGREAHNGVLAFLGATRFSARTDTSGAYSIGDVPPGTYELLAEKDGFEDLLIETLDLPAEGPGGAIRIKPVELKPRPPSAGPAADAPPEDRPASLAGDVSLGDGEEPSGALVRIRETGDATNTDAAGRFYFARVEPGAYRVEILKEGYRPAQVVANVMRGANNWLDPVTLVPQAETEIRRVVLGRVEMRDSGGRPRAEFDAVRVIVQELGRDAGLELDGSFRLEDLPARELTFTASAPGYRLDEPVRVDLALSDMADISLQLLAIEAAGPGRGALTGIIARRGVEGSLGGTAVGLSDTAFSGVTDPSGRFRFEDVPEGVYRFHAQAEGFEPVELDGVGITAGETTDLGRIELEQAVDPPKVLETRPPHGATDVLVAERVPVFIRFSKPMRPESLKAAFSVDPPVDYRIYTGGEHPQSDSQRLVVELLGAAPGRPVEFLTTYEIRISVTATDADNVPLEEDFSFRFRTGGPMVVRSTPADGESDASLNPSTPLVFHLNDQILTRSLTDREITVKPAMQANPRVAVVNDPISGWSRIQVYGTWNPDSQYTVTLGRGVETFDRKKLGNTPYAITFRTAPWISLAPQDTGRQRNRPGRSERR